MLNRNKAAAEESIIVGHVYKDKDEDIEVIPFFLDLANSRVKFAPVGRSSEEETRMSDFLKRFNYLGEVSSMAEKQSAKRAAPDSVTVPKPNVRAEIDAETAYNVEVSRMRREEVEKAKK